MLLLQAFARAASNSMLVYSDEAFTMSLIYYNMVREMSRRGDPVATVLFDTLRPFFRRRTPRQDGDTAEPSTKELERDIHALLHDTKDREIIIKNETPAQKAACMKSSTMCAQTGRRSRARQALPRSGGRECG